MERKQFKGVCKQCGKEYRYTEQAYIADISHGRSPSTRCDSCRYAHKKFVTSFGISYFPAQPEVDTAKQLSRLHLNGLGTIKRVLPSPKSEVYSGIPTPEVMKKFTAVASTMDELVKAVETHGPGCPRFIITVLPTGSGKSVYLPYRLLLSQAAQLGKIYVTEPRLSVLKSKTKDGKGTLPWYIGTQLLQAPEPGYGKGFEIGVQYAGDASRVDHYNNRLIFVSDGLLIRMALTGELANVSVVVIDEAHEKSANMVTLFTLFKIVLPRYPKLKVVFASATVDPQEFVDFYAPASVLVLQPKGITTQANITVNWPEQSGANTFTEYEERWGYLDNLNGIELPANNKSIPNEQLIPQAVAEVVNSIRTVEGFTKIGKPMGDVIVFVATKRVLYDTIQVIEALKLEKLKVYPCHAEMQSDKQRKFDKSEQKAKRILEAGEAKTEQRVIVGTNYIETGITITADYVIDSGFVLEPRWRSDLCTTEYNVEQISRDKARQRWGRVGRLSNCPGEVFCLYAKEDFCKRPEFTPSEITRTNLDDVYLTLKAAGIEDIQKLPIFGFDEQDIAQRQEKERALRQLPLTGAVDKDGDITFRGRLINGTRTSLVNYGLLLVYAEELGCHLEVATFLAFIERSGTEGLFLDSDQGLLAYERWRMGVLDDLEFYLRLFLHWHKAKVSKTKTKTKTKKKDNRIWSDIYRDHLGENDITEAAHRVWAENQGLNHDTFSKIDRKREELLKEFQRGTHVTSSVRYFDLRRIHRVRGAIARAMPEWLFLFHSGFGSNMIFAPAKAESCPSNIDKLKIDQESACARSRQLKAFICIDRTFVKNIVYARHVVAVEEEWIEYLYDATVARLALLLRSSLKQESYSTRDTKGLIESFPSYSVNISDYSRHQLLRLQVMRSRISDKQNFSCYLAMDLDRNVPLLVRMKDTRVAVEDEFRAVIVNFSSSRQGDIIEISQIPIIKQAYSLGSVYQGKVLATNYSDGYKTDEGIDAVFVRFETGVDGRLRRKSYGFWVSEFDSLSEGDTIEVQIKSIHNGKIDLTPPIQKIEQEEHCTGYVQYINHNNIRVQLAPGVWGTLYKERTTISHLKNFSEGDSIDVKILEPSKGGKAQYLLAHPDYGSEPEEGNTYQGIISGFLPNSPSSKEEIIGAFVNFYPGVNDGFLFHKENDLTTLSKGDVVKVVLQNIKYEEGKRTRYSLKIVENNGFGFPQW